MLFNEYAPVVPARSSSYKRHDVPRHTSETMIYDDDDNEDVAKKDRRLRCAEKVVLVANSLSISLLKHSCICFVFALPAAVDPRNFHADCTFLCNTLCSFCCVITFVFVLNSYATQSESSLNKLQSSDFCTLHLYPHNIRPLKQKKRDVLDGFWNWSVFFPEEWGVGGMLEVGRVVGGVWCSQTRTGV